MLPPPHAAPAPLRGRRRPEGLRAPRCGWPPSWTSRGLRAGERLALALAREHVNGPGRPRPGSRSMCSELPRDSQYETTDTMCQILPKGVVSVLGPAASPAAAATVSHICGEKEIPHIRVGPETASRPPASLICARPECLLRLEELVRQFLISRESLSVRVLDGEQDPTPLLKEIRDDKVPTIVIDGPASTAGLVLAKGSSWPRFGGFWGVLAKVWGIYGGLGLGMMSTFYKYILTTMDFPLLHLESLPSPPATVLGFSMFNTSHRFYGEFVRSLNMSWRESCDLGPYPGPALSAALLFDAVHVVVAGVELNRSQEIGCPLASCRPEFGPHGTSLMNYLRMVEHEGLTGRVEFNSKGQRTNYSLRVLEKGRDGTREVGVWFSNHTLAMDEATLGLNSSESLENKTLIITTILENPCVMRVGGAGGERYEGFCVDMLRELARLLKFRFQLRLVEDGLYGAPEPNGSWTGMVGELINRKADLAVAAFTITAEREKVIDFSKPFMTLGISILYRCPHGRGFRGPFSPAVWLFMLLAYLAVSCVLFLAAR
ncbi:glutamate receptor ionotropic, kainate 5-like, partial [Myiozetetes cayanensis]|uniref:glutamate receptor ionotropic, kainate 5-like n=1 Tax=Myiozetetes cayanensis TaxID=478635 RepID=UPI00215F87BA